MVVLDYAMPQMNGKAAFEALLKINQEVKVLLCSGYSEEETIAAFGKTRPAAFIHKPYKTSDLFDRMGRVLAQNGK